MQSIRLRVKIDELILVFYSSMERVSMNWLDMRARNLYHRWLSSINTILPVMIQV